MRKLLLGQAAITSAVALTAASFMLSHAQAAALTPGDVLVLRGGDGSSGQGASTVSVWLDEYNPTTDALVQSISVPSTGSNALTIGQTTTTEGDLDVSTNGQFITFAGYRVDAGTSGTPQSKSAAVDPRIIGILGLDGSVDTSTSVGDAFGSSSVRSVASTDGTQFWVSGISGAGATASGLVYVNGVGASSSTILRTSNYRNDQIFDNSLYISSASTISLIGTAGTLPTSGSQTATTVVNGGAGISEFKFFDLDNTGSADTLYLVDTGVLKKYCLVSGVWTAEGTIDTTVASMLNLTATENTDGSISLYFTNPTVSGGQLDTLTDTSGFGATLNGSVSTIALTATYETFRGVAVVPLPEPASFALFGMAAGALFARRSRRTK